MTRICQALGETTSKSWSQALFSYHCMTPGFLQRTLCGFWMCATRKGKNTLLREHLRAEGAMWDENAITPVIPLALLPSCHIQHKDVKFSISMLLQCLILLVIPLYVLLHQYIVLEYWYLQTGVISQWLWWPHQSLLLREFKKNINEC